MVKPDTRPNIILINCDDLGYGDLACYGSQVNSTPYIDRLANDGIRFTDFYMASPVCSPSRAAMLTGCYPQRVGMSNVLRPGSAVGLSSSEETLSSTLSRNGYATQIVGKWHLGDQPEFLPTEHGFDHYYGVPYSNDMGRQLHNELSDDGRKAFPPLPLLRDTDVIQEQPSQEGLTERYTEEAVRFIRDNQDGPFFLYFAHMHVHRPILVSRRFVDSAKNGRYGAAVEAIDWSLGVLMHELETLGLDKNTLVIFTSDNGSRADLGGSNGNLRGTKMTTWEGGMRLPLIVRWAGHIEPNQTSRELISSLDFLPTIASIAGCELQSPNVIDGQDLSSLLLEPEAKSSRDSFFYYFNDILCAVRSGKWKLHVVTTERELPSRKITSTTVVELYDLETDASETTNVAEAHPEIVEKLTSLIDACRVDLGDEHTSTVGLGRRAGGRVASPATLTQFDPTNPVLWAEYDTDEFG